MTGLEAYGELALLKALILKYRWSKFKRATLQFFQFNKRAEWEALVGLELYMEISRRSRVALAAIREDREAKKAAKG